MRKVGSSVLLPFDIEIERTYRRNRKEKRAASTQQTSTMDPNIVNNDGANDQRALRDYVIPTVNGASTSIRRPAIQVNNFEIKLAIIQMIQTSVQFNGLAHEDPNAHIANFLEICDTFRHNGVSDDAVKLRLFPFSLRDKAKSWSSSLPPGTITTWDDLAQKFLAKFFPPTKTVKLRNDIATFTQFDMESLYEAWERYKEMRRRCPHHGLPKWLQVQTFYNGLGASTRTLVDAEAGGALMGKSIDEAYDLLEEMDANAFSWPSERLTPKKAFGVHEVDNISALTAQLATLNKQLGVMTAQSFHIPQVVCELCSGNHPSMDCQVGNPFAPSFSEQVSYGNQNAARPPPRFQPQEKKVNLEEALTQLTVNTSKFMIRTETTLQNQAAFIRNLEVQVGQLASMMTERHQGSLPSNTETNPREHVNAITLQSGKKLEEPKDKMKEQKREQHESSSSNQAKTEEDNDEE
ncbi:DNA-directed DNA polymerase [Melia azedarach]|uniref:DNA-directed DNA polymerase n=1 Tax=Melia azedarach TaxID=155640 RepID=A0ACC1YAU8_MELAZ|nr:DNA-directed DNA polymerase [Melia azedarach]